MASRVRPQAAAGFTDKTDSSGPDVGNVLDYLIACLEKESNTTTYLQEQSGKVCFLDGFAAKLKQLIFADPPYVELSLDNNLASFQTHYLSYHRKDTLYLALRLQSERKGQHQIFTPAYFTEVRLEEVDGCFRISKQDHTPTFNQSLLRGLAPHEVKNILEDIEAQLDWTSKIGVFEAHLEPRVSERLLDRPFLFLSGTIKSVQTGLIQELQSIREQKPEELYQTSLRFLLKRPGTVAGQTAPARIWNVFAMNESQTKAVEYALKHPFTVITGPPGTGKSQVVLNLLANLALNQQTVLFASKNNQAVNTVIEKLEGIQANYCPFVRIGNKAEKQKGLERLLKGLKANYPPSPGAIPSEQLQNIKVDQDKLQRKLAALEDLFEQQYLLLQDFSAIRTQLPEESRINLMGLLPGLSHFEEILQQLHQRTMSYALHQEHTFISTEHYRRLETAFAQSQIKVQKLENRREELRTALEQQRQNIQLEQARLAPLQENLYKAQNDLNNSQQAFEDAQIKLQHQLSALELVTQQSKHQQQTLEESIESFRQALANQPAALKDTLRAFPAWEKVQAWSARCQDDLDHHSALLEQQQQALEELLQCTETELRLAEDTLADLRAGLDQIESVLPNDWGETLKLHRQTILDKAPIDGTAFLTLKVTARTLLDRGEAPGLFQWWRRRQAQQKLPTLLQEVTQCFGAEPALPQLFLMQALKTVTLKELVDFMDHYPDLQLYRQLLLEWVQQSQAQQDVSVKRNAILGRLADNLMQAPADFCPRHLADLPEKTRNWIQEQLPLKSLADIQHQLHRIPHLRPLWDQYAVKLVAIHEAEAALAESQAQSRILELASLPLQRARQDSEFSVNTSRAAANRAHERVEKCHQAVQEALEREVNLVQECQSIETELLSACDERDACQHQLTDLELALTELHQAQARQRHQEIRDSFELLHPALLTDITYQPPAHLEAIESLLQKLESVFAPLRQMGKLRQEMDNLTHQMNRFDQQHHYRERLAQLQQELVRLSVETFNAANCHRYHESLSSLEQLLRTYFGQWQEKTLLELFHKLSPIVPIWVTTNLSTRYNIPLAPGIFDYVIVDEASQNDIASILPLLYRARNVVIIGDPQQLKHIAGIRARDIDELLQQHGLQADTISYHYLNNSAFDLAARRFNEVAGQAPFLLREHYRCHGEIVEFSNRLFYQSKLFAKSYIQKDITPAQAGIHWRHVAGHYDDKRNLPEARAIVACIRDLYRDGLAAEVTIGVITPFRNQEILISRLLLEAGINKGRENDRVFCSTVHRFQGDERDIILYSPVLSDEIRPQTLEWLDSSQDLLNVAVTRARSALIIFGDTRFCDGTQALHQRLLDYCRQFESRRHIPYFESETEQLFYEALRQHGFVFDYQREVGRYRIDFVLKQSDGYLCVELDGSQHDENRSYDYSRSSFLKELGYRVLRYRNEEIRENLNFILQGLALTCEQNV